MPLYLVERRSRGRFRSEHRPLFAGYLFFCLGEAKTCLSKVRSTHGVSQVIGTGVHGLARVPNEIVEGLMQRCDASGLLQPEQDFVIGDKVRITSGPFADFVSKVEKIDKDQRLHVLLDLLGGQTTVAVRPEHVMRNGTA